MVLVCLLFFIDDVLLASMVFTYILILLNHLPTLLHFITKKYNIIQHNVLFAFIYNVYIHTHTYSLEAVIIIRKKVRSRKSKRRIIIRK